MAQVWALALWALAGGLFAVGMWLLVRAVDDRRAERVRESTTAGVLTAYGFTDAGRLRLEVRMAAPGDGRPTKCRVDLSPRGLPVAEQRLVLTLVEGWARAAVPLECHQTFERVDDDGAVAWRRSRLLLGTDVAAVSVVWPPEGPAVVEGVRDATAETGDAPVDAASPTLTPAPAG